MGAITSIPVASWIAPAKLTRRQGVVEKSSSPAYSTAVGGRAHELFQTGRRVVVVDVGLVELDHRELRVVGRVHALVAEVLADLVDALQARRRSAA